MTKLRRAIKPEPVGTRRSTRYALNSACQDVRYPEETALRAPRSRVESRELDGLPTRIEALEAEQKALTVAMSSADYHKRGGDQMRRDAARAQDVELELEAAFERWAELDARR